MDPVFKQVEFDWLDEQCTSAGLSCCAPLSIPFHTSPDFQRCSNSSYSFLLVTRTLQYPEPKFLACLPFFGSPREALARPSDSWRSPLQHTCLAARSCADAPVLDKTTCWSLTRILFGDLLGWGGYELRRGQPSRFGRRSLR